jgi:hypothetical protein
MAIGLLVTDYSRSPLLLALESAEQTPTNSHESYVFHLLEACYVAYLTRITLIKPIFAAYPLLALICALQSHP